MQTRSRCLKIGSLAYWEDRIEDRIRQGKRHNVPHARDVIARGQRILRQAALLEAGLFLGLWPKTQAAVQPAPAAAPAAPAPPAKPKESLLLARRLPCVLEGVAVPFNQSGGPTSVRTGQVIDASIRSGAFSHQITHGRVALAVNHEYSGDPNDAHETLATQADGTLRLWTADNRLHFRARLRDTALGREIVVKAKRGEIAGMSVRYTPRRQDAYGSAECTLDGELVEISVLTGRSQPAFPGTSCRLLHAPASLSVHHPEFRALASDTAIGAARRQLRVCRG